MVSQKALIVGAGIGGLASAISLSDVGYEVEVIEIRPDMRSSVLGVGIIQAPNQLRALDSIGCARRCLEQGYAAKNLFKDYDRAGNLVRTIPGPRIHGLDFPPMNGITRPRFHKILTDKARSVGATVDYGKTITEIRQSGSRVEVGITDGTIRTFDLVVGADGVRSAVRSYVLGPQWTPQYTGKSVFRINVPRLPEMDAILRQEGQTEEGEMVGVGLVPLAPDLGYLWVNVAWDRSIRPSRHERRTAVKQKLAAFDGPAGVVRDNYLDTDEEMVLRPEEYLIAPPPWNKGRVVLIGDAVHTVTPNTAQGAAQAIEDGIVLARSLVNYGSVEDALAAYTECRYERCRLVVEFGYKARQWEANPTSDFDPEEAGLRMREALLAPI